MFHTEEAAAAAAASPMSSRALATVNRSCTDMFLASMMPPTRGPATDPTRPKAKQEPTPHERMYVAYTWLSVAMMPTSLDCASAHSRVQPDTAIFSLCGARRPL